MYRFDNDERITRRQFRYVAAVGVLAVAAGAVLLALTGPARRLVPLLVHRAALPVERPLRVRVTPSVAPAPDDLRAGSLGPAFPDLARFTLDPIPGVVIGDLPPPWATSIAPKTLGLKAAAPGRLAQVTLPALHIVPAPAAVFGAVNTVERLPDGAFAPVDSELDAYAVVDRLSARRGALIASYERVLKNNPLARGVVEVRFTVARDGTVRRVAVVRDTLGQPAVANRVASVVRTTQFPSSPGGEMRFAYPFVFRPVE